MKISRTCTSIATALLSTSALLGDASAFSIAPMTASTTTTIASRTTTTTTALNYKPQHFDRAVECATTVGECDLDELESLANELEVVNNGHGHGNDIDTTNNQDAGEVIKVKEILRAQHKFMTMNEEYQKELAAARAAKNQLVSWPSEEDLQEEKDQEPSQQEIPQPSQPSLSQSKQEVTKQDGKKTPLVPMQVVYQDAKDFAMDIHDEYGPYARQLAYQGEDYFD